ncbi:hypothetical protein EGH73_03125 [Epilithonimonas hominis]|uniref:Uncharacterized protein n=1 Tax=Epilithonimonas hominis TaxID=420404 RepID=A0A3N0XAJ6_9FLAO|nr:hypothetical protein EGH73_03125 [Epilithonimonas hominis]
MNDFYERGSRMIPKLVKIEFQKSEKFMNCSTRMLYSVVHIPLKGNRCTLYVCKTWICWYWILEF